MADFAPGLPSKEVHGDLSKLKPGEFVDFIVQKHEARKAGTHYDVRLGTPSTGLYSWATRKELPGPKGKIGLFRQPLHTHEYKEFEGEIPEGYGAGKVTKADEGKLLVNKVSDKILHFTRVDKKFPERFALIAPKEEKKPWLLVNNTPTEPIPYEKIRYTKVHPDHAETILDGLQPGSSVQAKIDGAAALTKLMEDKLEVVSYRTSSQTGHPIVHTERVFKGPAKVSIPKKYVGTILRQELFGEKKGKVIPPQELGGILNSSVLKAIEDQKQREIELRNLVFDIQQLGKTPTKDLPYERRLELVKEVLQHLPRDRFQSPEEARTPEAAKLLYERIKAGEHPLTREGIVVHPPTGKPSKIKFVEDHDVFITGTFPPEKGSKYEGKAVGGFTYALKPNGPTVGKVGTGLSDDLRRELHKSPMDYVGRVARIRAQEQYATGKFRAPALIALHEDYPLKKTSSDGITFPSKEIPSLQSRLNSGKPIFTTRIKQEMGKYQKGKEYGSPLGALKATQVQRLKRGQHPFYNQLSESQKKLIDREESFDLVRLEKISEAQEIYEQHGHPRAPVGSVSWHFHNYEHGYKHCKGPPSNPYTISHHKDFHIIDREYARGHGINRKPTWFQFTEKIGPGRWILESGIKVEGMKKTSASKKYDPPMSSSEVERRYPHLLKDPAHSWRASKGIELIHKEPSRKELKRIWKNWQLMTPEQKEESDRKSKELFGISNLENYQKLLPLYPREEPPFLEKTSALRNAANIALMYSGLY